MIPEKPLPCSDEFASADDYVSELLDFTTTTDIFQILCGGVHVLDFFTNEPGLFNQILPQEWQPFLLSYNTMALLDLLMRDDLDALPLADMDPAPPESFLKYIRAVRRLSLRRSFSPSSPLETRPPPKLSRSVAVGMKPKKVHEVSHFARYVDGLAGAISSRWGKETTHFVDFGSGQNYLGRTLALPPYNRHVVAVEGREHNIDGAKGLDVLSGLASKEVVMRNKKLWLQMQADRLGTDVVKKTPSGSKPSPDAAEDFDFRPIRELEPQYNRALGKGSVSYVVGRLESGDLTEVIGRIEKEVLPEEENKELKMMAVSIHSCGNLSHYGIRSLVMNPAIHSVAIVGCCYNLLTEKLGPPTYKFAYARPSLQALNGRVVRESERRDPEGFPLSETLSGYKGHGVRMNITARMMACQAPQNWTQSESDDFFTRHLFRAILQKMFLDRGVISKVYHREAGDDGEEHAGESPFNTSTNPVIIGSLRKACYRSLADYVRGAVAKLTTNREYSQYSDVIREKMGDISDEEIAHYEKAYLGRKKEVAAVWSLMAFSACVVESLIVTDRWLFLKEHADVVRDCWVETVFDYKESPRNLVVVGIKK
ncbi:Methyltransferase-like protein 25 [Colletotrichum chlorophyti]|uniref:Methyltransferase-like protein 25 n=1 Tax=Colletotrichum chlorophyti TaxID=708187 RepID=A0A1Q8RD91_9PEZI|nr:Methyltransferase-like protein 25 [Colletotrichum chlorophyti]